MQDSASVVTGFLWIWFEISFSLTGKLFKLFSSYGKNADILLSTQSVSMSYTTQFLYILTEAVWIKLTRVV